MHQDNGIRNIYPTEIQAYKEDWDALFSPTTTRPYAPPDHFLKYVGEIGLPFGHPDAAVFDTRSIESGYYASAATSPTAGRASLCQSSGATGTRARLRGRRR